MQIGARIAIVDDDKQLFIPSKSVIYAAIELEAFRKCRRTHPHRKMLIRNLARREQGRNAFVIPVPDEIQICGPRDIILAHVRPPNLERVVEKGAIGDVAGEAIVLVIRRFHVI